MRLQLGWGEWKDGGVQEKRARGVDIKYHIVWIVKNRYKMMRGRIAERARDLIRQTCEARGVHIVRGAISPDHIHMLAPVPPDLSPKMVQ